MIRTTVVVGDHRESCSLSIIRFTPPTDDRFSPDDLDMSRQIYSLPGSLVYGIQYSSSSCCRMDPYDLHDLAHVFYNRLDL